MAGEAGRLRRATLAGAALAACCAASASSPVQSLAGRWSSHFRNGLVDGSSYWSDDVAEIVPVDAGHAYVRFALNFFNGHVCSLSGVARAEGPELVFRDVTDVAADGVRCTLHVSAKGGDLHWQDEGGTCKGYCGARGSFLDGSLPGRSHRPISYMPRLKASPDYRDALTTWRTGKPVKP